MKTCRLKALFCLTYGTRENHQLLTICSKERTCTQNAAIIFAHTHARYKHILIHMYNFYLFIYIPKIDGCNNCTKTRSFYENLWHVKSAGRDHFSSEFLKALGTLHVQTTDKRPSKRQINPRVCTPRDVSALCENSCRRSFVVFPAKHGKLLLLD